MQLPPFTWKSSLLFLIGVIAALLGVWFLIEAMRNAEPQKRIPPQPPPADTRLAPPAQWSPTMPVVLKS